MSIIHCPFCGSDDVYRLGLYEYQCGSCSEPFDINECDDDEIDGFDGPDDR